MAAIHNCLLFKRVVSLFHFLVNGGHLLATDDDLLPELLTALLFKPLVQQSGQHGASLLRRHQLFEAFDYVPRQGVSSFQ